MKVIYNRPDFSNNEELYILAKVHESAPLNRNSEYVIRDERLDQWVDFFKKYSHSNEFNFIVARDGEKIVGLHWIKMSEKYNTKCAHIDSLWVHGEYRKQGIGARMKSIGEEWAKGMGAKFITTNVFYTNKEMIEFNLKLGFEAQQVKMIKGL